MKSQYLIITNSRQLILYQAEDAKQALCQYAANLNFRVRNELFAKMIAPLTISEAVEFFNQQCWDWSEAITKILTGCITVYGEE